MSSVANVGYIPVSPMPLQGNFSSGNISSGNISSSDLRGQASKHADVKPANNEPKKVAKPQIHSTAADLEQVSLVFNRRLQFIVDQNSNEVIVKVIDKETDKVIKELPPEELQRLHKNVKEVIGFLFDERV